MSAKRKFWIIGIALAGIGVALARLVSSRFDQPVLQLVMYGLGILFAFAGLGVMMYAMKRDLK